MARKCGWSKQRTNAILTGKQKLSFEDGLKICDVLGVPYDYFCNVAAQDSIQSSA
ncbi:helix-turn-helix transcriptional regulator [Oscillospiraceae bacterium 38-13]